MATESRRDRERTAGEKAQYCILGEVRTLSDHAVVEERSFGCRIREKEFEERSDDPRGLIERALPASENEDNADPNKKRYVAQKPRFSF